MAVALRSDVKNRSRVSRKLALKYQRLRFHRRFDTPPVLEVLGRDRDPKQDLD